MLKDKKLYEDAMIVITSDHGELIEEDSILFDHGVNLHPALIKVPLLIKLPKYLRFESTICSRLVSNVSITPTILDVCDINIDNKKFDGINLIQDKTHHSNSFIFASTQILNAQIFDMNGKIEITVQPIKSVKRFVKNLKHIIYSWKFTINKFTNKVYCTKMNDICVQRYAYNKYDIIVPLSFAYAYPIIMFLSRIII